MRALLLDHSELHARGLGCSERKHTSESKRNPVWNYRHPQVIFTLPALHKTFSVKRTETSEIWVKKTESVLLERVRIPKASLIAKKKRAVKWSIDRFYQNLRPSAQIQVAKGETNIPKRNGALPPLRGSPRKLGLPWQPIGAKPRSRFFQTTQQLPGRWSILSFEQIPESSFTYVHVICCCPALSLHLWSSSQFGAHPVEPPTPQNTTDPPNERSHTAVGPRTGHAPMGSPDVARSRGTGIPHRAKSPESLNPTSPSTAKKLLYRWCQISTEVF